MEDNNSKTKTFISSHRKRITIFLAGFLIASGIGWSAFGQEYVTQIKQGDALLSEGKYAAAVEAYPENFIGPEPERVREAWHLVPSDKQYRAGINAYSSGDYKQAYLSFCGVTSEYPQYDNAQELLETSKNLVVNDYLSKAKEEYDQGQIQDALDFINAGLAVVPDSSELFFAWKGYDTQLPKTKSVAGNNSYSNFTWSTPGTNEDQNNEYRVYITKTGSKYHSAGCQYLRQSQIAISVSDAISEGYTSCSKCNP